MKIAGFFNGHDCSYCILENGIPIIHAEYERYLRLKEPDGDSYGMLLDITKNIDDIDYFVAAGAAGSKNIFRHKEEWKNSYPECTGRKAPNLQKHKDNPKVQSLLAWPDKEILQVGHHKCHAANAFFSSNIEESLIITIDGGGREESSPEHPAGRATSTTIWKGVGNKIYPIDMGFDLPDPSIKIGVLYKQQAEGLAQNSYPWFTRRYDSSSIDGAYDLDDDNLDDSGGALNGLNECKISVANPTNPNFI